MAILAPSRQANAFLWIVFVLGVVAIATFTPLWVPLVLATWTAAIARPLLLKISRAIGGRERAAGILVVALVMVIAVPIGLMAFSLTNGVIGLAKSLVASSGTKSALVALASGGGDDAGGSGGGDAGASMDLLKSPQKIVGLVQEHGAQAMKILGGIAGAATAALIGLFIFLYAVYTFLVDGPSYYDWLERHAPIDASSTKRFAAAFKETGRGLFVGIGLTGIAQGAVATVAYLALGVPRALVLGMLTCLVSVIPSVGTALVWVPIAIGLALSGKLVSAGIMAGVGVVVIGSVDNVMRPIFARFGKLNLSSFVLLTSIFGGLTLFGTWGFLLGPLVVRLAVEAFTIAREDRLKIELAAEARAEPTEN